MSGKIVQKTIGFTVVCALLAGCLAGCGLTGKDSTEKTPAAKTLRRETETNRDDYGGAYSMSVMVTEYLENGLAARVYTGPDNDTEAQEASYDYDTYGAPIRMYMDHVDNAEAVIEITNSYENGKIVSVQISDVLLNGESALDADLVSASIVFQYFLPSLLRLLQHYEGYRDAEISIRNTENCIRLQNGAVVYSCYDYGYSYMKQTTEITQDSNGHKTTLVTQEYDSGSNVLTTISEADEYGRIVKYGVARGQQSMIMQIEYEVQTNSDTHTRTEAGHIVDFQNDLDTDYSDDQLEEMISQVSFIYTFDDDILVFSEVNFDTQKTTSEYSADRLLLRQTVEINAGEYIHSTVTEYEYQ